MKTITRSTASLFPTSTIITVALAIISSLSVNGRFRRIRSLLRAKRTRVLCGLVGIGISMGGTSFAFGQQGLHVVASPFINNSSLSGTVALADNDIWAVGTITGNMTSNNVTLVEHFNGASWSVIPTPAVRGGGFAAVDGVASNDVWAVGQQAAGSSVTALIEHWDGTSWSVVSGPNVGHGTFFSGVTAVSSNDVWAAGSNNSHNSSAPLVEHWDGTSWSVVSSPAFTGVGGIRGISSDASNDVWAVAGPTFLHWNGQTWSQVSAPSRFGGNAVTVLSPSNVWAAGSRSGEHPDSLEAIAHWDGSSWNFVASVDPFVANHGSSLFEGIAAVSASNIWAIGIGAGGSFTEQWNGTSWSLLNTPSGVALFGVTALGDGLVVAVGDTCVSSCNAVILQN
jgi:hypothetical protein